MMEELAPILHAKRRYDRTGWYWTFHRIEFGWGRRRERAVNGAFVAGGGWVWNGRKRPVPCGWQPSGFFVSLPIWPRVFVQFIVSKTSHDLTGSAHR